MGVINGDFETGDLSNWDYEQWGSGSPNTVEVTNAWSNSGTYSARMILGDGAVAYLATYITNVTPESTLSFYIAWTGEEVGYIHRMRLLLFDSISYTWSYEYDLSSYINTELGWQHIELNLGELGLTTSLDELRMVVECDKVIPS